MDRRDITPLINFKRARRRTEQFTTLEKLKNDIVVSRGWLVPKSIETLLVAWFINKERDTKHSRKIYEQIVDLWCHKYKKYEPIVQFELCLWKAACLRNYPPLLNNNNTNTSNSNSNSSTIMDPVTYFVRGGWKKTKCASRHDPMIGIVITNVLPFLTNDDYEIACLRAEFPINKNDTSISTVIVSNAGYDNVNGTYKRNDVFEDVWNGPVFTKPGMYDGEQVLYWIYKDEYSVEDGEDVSCWYLSAIPTGEIPGDDVDYNIFYYNGGNDDRQRIPPATHWKKDRGFGIGKNPPPLIVPVNKVL